MQILHTEDGTTLVSLLKSGAVGVMPTDTVYGLVCSASKPEAVHRLYELKSRENKPGTIIAARIQQLIDLGIRARYLKAVEQFWPNPLSVVIPCDDHLEYLHLKQHSLAVRIPKDAALTSLLMSVGPLLTTSANHPAQPTAKNLHEAQKYFGESVDFYVDGGSIDDHQPSTIIRVVDDAIEVLRQGAVHIDETGRIN